MKQEDIWNKLYKANLTWKKETIELPNLLNDKDVLELGVGTGKTLQSILRQNPKSITAIDFSEAALKRASETFKSKKQIKFLKIDITKLPFKEEFDVIVCYYVLNNLRIEERKKVTAQIYKSLKKGGILLFEDLAQGDFREKKKSKQIETHTIERENHLICHFFSEREIKQLFSKFKEIKTEEKISNPIKSYPKLERKIIRAIIRK